MNILLLIDGEKQEITASNFEISYKKYEGTDVVILINTKLSMESPIYEEFPPVTTPSSKGIVTEEFGPMPLVQVAEQDLMVPLRKDAGLIVVNFADPPKDPEHVGMFLDFKDTVKSVGLESDEFTFNEKDAFQNAAISLVEREKKLVFTKYLLVNKEPYFEFKNGTEKIILKEVVTVLSLVTRKEEAKIVKHT